MISSSRPTLLLLSLCIFGLSDNLAAQEPAAVPPKLDTPVRQAISLPVEFPLDATRETKLLASLESLSSRSNGTDRPLVVLEFKSAQQSTRPSDELLVGRGTPFERSLSLARWISGPKGNRLQTVAYIPQSIGGHAVLIAIACEEIAIAPDAEFGQASMDESATDATIKQAYIDIAARRATFPPAAVVSMLDSSEPLVRIDSTDGKMEYVSSSELKKRERNATEWNETQLVPFNQLARFVGQELRNWRWVAHIAGDKQQLANALRLNKPIVEQPVFEGDRVAVRTHLRGIITPRHVNRMLRAIEEGLAKKETNLVLVEVDSPGGNLTESLRLAQYLADIGSDRAEVVCYIPGVALGDASLIALACDSIMMHPDGKIGGPGEASVGPAECNNQRAAIESLAQSSGRSIGELLGCVCPTMPIFEYSSFDGRTQLQSPEWLQDDPVAPQWNQGAQIDFSNGLNFETASELKIAIDNPVSIQAVGSKFGIEELPAELKTNATEEFIDWLAGQMWFSFFLFFVGFTALSAELSAPGVGFPGILAAICFGLFFWLRVLGGTVEWLEVLLILGGIVCLLLEAFVLPGFGIFGITGLGLLGVGLLLAGQTFILPTNDYQRQRVVTGFGQIGLVALSLLALAFAFRKQIANSPMVRWIALQPPSNEREKVEKERIVEELQMYVGWHGTTLSRCNPSGKAMIGDKLHSIVAEAGWLDENVAIEVVRIHENTLIVRQRS
jgi:membrane-bound serine protease (ClpP class)